MTHSPEPWRMNGEYIATADDDQSIYADEVGRANAERIVACVNFCNGIPTHELTKFGEGKDQCPADTWARLKAEEAAAAALRKSWYGVQFNDPLT